MAFPLTINGLQYVVDAEPETPLLWALRDTLDLTGTKYGCGIGQCGACTVHVNGQAVRSCSIPVSAAVGATITTIEGLSADGTHPVQLAWKESRRAAMRLLLVRDDHGRGGAAAKHAGARGRGHRQCS